jgi:hypothetical protein
VDALSSHVATAVQGSTLDKVKVPRKQARDTPCAKRNSETRRRKREVSPRRDSVQDRQKPNELHQLIENLKASLKMAYKQLAKSRKKSHQNNKRLYDKRDRTRNFEVNDLVFLYTPVTKCDLREKFRHPWTGPFKVTKKLSYLNYEITSVNGKSQVVHVNWLKRAYDSEIWKPKQRSEIPKKQPKRKATKPEEWEEDEVQLSSLPLLIRAMPERRHEPQAPPNQIPNTPGSAQETPDTPCSERSDPSYEPPRTPRSRRELQAMRPEPPITRSRTQVQTQDRSVVEASTVLHAQYRKSFKNTK